MRVVARGVEGGGCGVWGEQGAVALWCLEMGWMRVRVWCAVRRVQCVRQRAPEEWDRGG